MKKYKSFILACGFMMLLPGGFLLAQGGCQVLKPELIGSYTGKCKKGLAHGNGKAEGLDTYEGQFAKGLPNGSGTYTWANGDKYEGQWVKGMADGKGTMTYRVEGGDSVVSGIWKEDVYLGKVVLPPYQVTRMSGVIRHSIVKINDMGSGCRVSLFLAGNFNVDVENFTMASDSGEEYQSGRYYGLQNATVPYTVNITYRTWNTLHTAQSDVVFNFVINEAGTFEVSITN